MSRIITVGPSGRDYTSLSAALAGAVSAHTSPVSDGQPWIFECDAFVDGPVTVPDVSTNSTNYITIKAAQGAEHQGSFSQGYRIESSVNFQKNVYVLAAFTKLDGIVSTNTGGGFGFVVVGINVSVINCLGKSGRGVISTESNNGDNFYIANSLFVGRTINNCLSIERFRSGIKVYNSTFISASSDATFAVGPNTFEVANCVFFNSVGDGVTDTTFGVGSANNASSGLTAPGVNSVTSVTAAAFVDYANGDYSPAVGGALDGTGTDLSAELTDDITGATRTQWDIGAFGIISGSTTPTLGTITTTAVTSNSISFSIPVTY